MTLVSSPLLTRALPAAILLWGCAGADAKPAPPATSASDSKVSAANANADAVRVEVATLENSDASLRATIPGEVQGSRDATLASAQGGPIERVFVREGDRVKKGRTLVQVDTALYRIQKQQAETRLEQAQREVDRAEGLGTALPAAERERRNSQVSVLKNELALADLMLQRSTVRAPFAGVVAAVEIEVGEVVPPASPLLRLVRLDPLDVVLSVPDRDVVALKQGMEVEVSLAAQPGVLPGTIARISPTGDLETRAFRAEVEVANPDMRIMPGMIASVRISRTLEQGAVVIPQNWLVTRRDGVGVFLEDQGTVRYVPVTAGRIVREQVVVDEGLASGARVVITGHRQLADGDQVVVSREGTCCIEGRVQFN